MIKVESVKVQNYRSFKEIGNEIDELSRINVMVGKNNVGKTNLLRAIYLFFNPDRYNALIDRNHIKQITGGQSKDPKINVKFVDNELEENKKITYEIICDLNKKENERYKVISRFPIVHKKLSTSGKIRKHLNNKFKCVFLSTTDEDLDWQSEKLLNDLILLYYKRQNKEVRESIVAFEESYKKLKNTFEGNIFNIEDALSKQFGLLESIAVTPKLELN